MVGIDIDVLMIKQVHKFLESPDHATCFNLIDSVSSFCRGQESRKEKDWPYFSIFLKPVKPGANAIASA
jgi:hypothetical protein